MAAEQQWVKVMILQRGEKIKISKWIENEMATSRPTSFASSCNLWSVLSSAFKIFSKDMSIWKLPCMVPPIAHIVLDSTSFSLLPSLLRCRSSCTASRFMPIARHFWYRQNWHRLRCRLSMIQLRSSLHAYVRSFRTVLLKKPLHPSQLFEKLEKTVINKQESLYWCSGAHSTYLYSP